MLNTVDRIADLVDDPAATPEIMSRCDFCRCDPFRKPAWRWLLAEALCREGQERALPNDPAVGEAFDYQRALDAADTDTKRQAVDAAAPALAGAHALYVEGEPHRDEVEARLLAGESAVTISNKTGVPVDVVQCYATTFYDVQDSLGAGDWLRSEAIGMYLGMKEAPTEGQTWKYWALIGGPIVLDVLVADFHGRDEPHVADRHLLAQKARLLAWESVTGYSLDDTVKVIEKLSPLFLGPAGGSDSASKLEVAKALEGLILIVKLWAKAVAGREADERKRQQQKNRTKPFNRERRTARKETAHGREQQVSEDPFDDGWNDHLRPPDVHA
jgi:hypothetical protein